VDVEQQVDHFLAVAQPEARTLVALDFEVPPPDQGLGQMSLDQARAFLTLLGARLGRKPALYSGNLIKEELGNRRDAFFGGHRLWLAQYTPPPKVQASWDTYWLWQYADKKTGLQPNEVAGIPGDAHGNLDCNTYEGSKADLTASWAS
jgi:GH25 family lysozyme M1 (1,4-beta-N-acetylmuramidase)